MPIKLNHRLRNVLLAVLPGVIIAGLVVFANSAQKTSVTAPVQSGLVGYWNMDSNDINGTTLYDKSGQGNNGTISGAVSATGKIKQALSFDGVDDYVEVPDIATDLSSAFTVSFWVKMKAGASGSYTPMVEKNGVANTNYPAPFDIRSNTDVFPKALVFYYGESGTVAGNITVANVFPQNTWVFITVTFDNVNGGKAYKDGVLIGSNTATTSVLDENQKIMFAQRLDNLDFSAIDLDEVRIYNRALSADEILQNYNATKRMIIDSSLNNRWTNGLVLLQTFNGQDMDWGSTTAEALDRSGQGNNGDVKNGAAPVIGEVGQALQFDGVDDYVEVPDSASLDSPATTQALTISVWEYLKAYPPTETYLVSKDYNFYEFRIFSSGELRLYLGDGTSYTSYNSGYIVPLNEWHHLAVTVDGTYVKFYVDGSLVSTLSQTNVLGNTTLPLDIGWRSEHQWNTFHGTIDEVRIYNRALSASEILEHYQAGIRKTRI